MRVSKGFEIIVCGIALTAISMAFTALSRQHYLGAAVWLFITLSPAAMVMKWDAEIEFEHDGFRERFALLLLVVVIGFVGAVACHYLISFTDSVLRYAGIGGFWIGIAAVITGIGSGLKAFTGGANPIERRRG